jgi:hypothetical protein
VTSLSFPDANNKSPSLLNFTEVIGLICPVKIKGLKNFKRIVCLPHQIEAKINWSVEIIGLNFSVQKNIFTMK